MSVEVWALIVGIVMLVAGIAAGLRFLRGPVAEARSAPDAEDLSEHAIERRELVRARDEDGAGGPVQRHESRAG